MSGYCECIELCEMGPTCPAADPERPDTGCWRADACRHCGQLPEADGDHSCPCPHPDETCPDHPRTRDGATHA